VGLTTCYAQLYTYYSLLPQWWYGEPWTILPVVFLGVLAVLWGGAFYFYFNAVSSWQVGQAL